MYRTENNIETGFSVVFEDNGRVAYGYLLSPSGDIVGDVWLYNRCQTPVQPEWKDPRKLPFANPQPYVDELKLPLLPSSEREVEFLWRSKDPVEVDVLSQGRLIGRLQAGVKPGWAVAAAKDGPLAKILPQQDVG